MSEDPSNCRLENEEVPEETPPVKCVVSTKSMKSYLFFWPLALSVITGLPAFVLMHVYNLSNAAAALGLSSVSASQMFWLFYLFTAGPGLVAMLAVFASIPTIRFLYSYQLVVREDGIRLNPAHATLFGNRIKPSCQPIPWSRVEKIEYVPARPSSPPLIRIRVAIWPGGSAPSFDVNLLKLEVADRQSLIKALISWAPETVGSLALRQLTGTSGFERHAGFTQLWLDEMRSRNQRIRADSLSTGEILQSGRYTVIGKVPASGQANVYIAEDSDGTDSLAKVILKEFILPASLGEARQAASELFERECQLLRKLSHASIVGFRDSFIEDHRAYIVLEYVPGTSLSDLVNSCGCLDPVLVVELAQTMCAILKCLHSSGPPVVHRDFTPHNLIVGPSNELKLIDFAAAVELDAEDAAARSEAAGKLSYMGPEQFQGRATVQSDIYGLGATLFFLLTGKSPQPLTQLSPKEVDPSIPAGLDGIVHKCTAQKEADRYRDADEVQAELLLINVA